MKIKVAASQFQTIKGNIKDNINKALNLADHAVAEGVNVLLLQELFQSEYFCSTQNAKFFDYAISSLDNDLFSIFSNYCKKNNIVIPISFFEKQGQNYFNSLIVIDSHGKLSEVYRKSHIPDGPGYNEKFYFTPGDLGFKSVKTKFGKIGPLICWDQWFPEAARLTALKGAQIIFYPTAIGWHPKEKREFGKTQLNSWITMQKSHAIANGTYVVAINRVGTEKKGKKKIEFWGNSMIIDPSGQIIGKLGNKKEEILIREINYKKIDSAREHWPFLRDRRIDFYKGILKNPADE